MGKEINVVSNGLGKMGTAGLEKLLTEDGIKVIGGLDPNPSVYARKLLSDHGAEIIRDFSHLDAITAKLENRILVDFSTPKACYEIIKHIAEVGNWKAVIGTTPLKEYEKDIFDLSKNIPITPASNFSPEVNKFFKQMEYVSKLSNPESSVSIHEIHRVEKASTAGTAITMAKILSQGMNKTGYILLRENKAFDSKGTPIAMPEMKPDILKDYIQVSCERFGDEPGTHIVRIGNENDFIEYKVRATRASYAGGLAQAVHYIGGVETSGLHSYSKDVLGL